MAWVVDTCLLIDLAVERPEFFAASARLLDARLQPWNCPWCFGGQIAAVEESSNA